jgi:ribose transport system permease protein
MQSKTSVAMTTAAPTIVPKPKQLQWRDFVVYIFFAIVLAFFAVTIGDMGFLTVANLFNISRTTSMIAIMAIAMTFVIAVGALNSFFVTFFKIPSFLVTLGSMQLIRGLDMRVNYTKPVAIAETTFNSFFGSGWQPVATRYSGVPVDRVEFHCFLISNAASALAGLLYSGMVQTARYTFGTGAELAAIAAVILGGTSLFDGEATVIGTFVGALLIGTINNGLIIMGLDVSEQMMIAGGLIIVAVAFGRRPTQT